MTLLTGIWDWRKQTRLLESRIRPNGMLRSMLFGDSYNTNATENIEVTVRNGGRYVAPFVKKGAAAQTIRGYGATTRVITPPMIRNKMEFEPYKYLDRVPPGVVSLLGPGDDARVSEAAKREMRRDAEALNNYADDAEELLCGMMLGNASGAATLEFTVAMGGGEESEVYQLTYPRSSENYIRLTGANQWNNATNADPAIAMQAAKVRLAEVGLTATVAICGSNVGAHFPVNTEVKKNLDYRRLNQAGPIALGGVVPEGYEGAVYIGEYAGLPIWSYDRKVALLGTDGSTTIAERDIIDPDSMYVISVTQKADFVMEYGGIRDMEALQGDTLAARRFTKAWTENDPSGAWRLMESHPLPVPYEVDSVVQIRPLA